MTQPQNNFAAIDKRVADAKQAEAGKTNQPQADQQSGPIQVQPGQAPPVKGATTVQADAAKPAGPQQAGSPTK